VKLAYKVNRELIPLLLAYGVTILKRPSTKKSKAAYEHIVEAYACLDHHLGLLGLKVDSKDIPNTVYGVYYLNEHEPRQEGIS